MNVTRIYTGDDGRSHFEDLRMPLTGTQFGRMSKRIPVAHAQFRETDPSYSLDFHTAPTRQFVLTLAGAVEIETGDGTVRRLGPGSILLAEDTTGQGHISREVEGPRITVFLPVPEDLDISGWR
ncbi:MAG: hypothetical protein ACM3S1_02490 [Hyphomicrobiales bacterium]